MTTFDRDAVIEQAAMKLFLRDLGDFPLHKRDATTVLPVIVDAALASIEALHQPVEIEPSDTICGPCSFQLPNGRFFGKVVEWPCPTAQAIAEIKTASR